MSRRTRRIVIPLVTLALALGVVLVMAFSPNRSQPQPTPTDEQAVAGDDTQAEQPVDSAAQETRDQAEQPNDDATATAAVDDSEPVADESVGIEPENGPISGEIAAISLDRLHAARAEGESVGRTPEPLGSLDPTEHRIMVEFSLVGAGIDRIVSSEHWRTALAARKAEAHYKAIAAGVRPDQVPPLPADDLRLVLTEAGTLTARDPVTGIERDFTIPAFAAHGISITPAGDNTVYVRLLGEATGETPWSQSAPGVFETTIRNSDEQVVLHITRRYELGLDGDITLEQRLDNRTAAPLNVRWIQYGPSQLTRDRSPYIDMRRFRAAYQLAPNTNPTVIIGKDNDQIFERRSLLKRAAKANELLDEERKAGDPTLHDAEINELITIWPNEESIDNGFALSWFASTNRYFALSIHPSVEQVRAGELNLENTVEEIRHQAQNPGDQEDGFTFTVLYSPERVIEPNGSVNIDLGIYAGPMDTEQLTANDIFTALNLKALVLYQMSTLCAICTFQWLAHVLLFILDAVHFVLADWSLAIITLVVIVRAILHPLTKKSQINMQRFSKGMSALKPELEKLQKKYANEPKRLQQEQMKLWREHNISPFQMLGCLPMFLQMPIWVALYAALYFAFDLRQEPAFYGFFQLFGNWQFLADLASPDRFISILPEPKTFTLIFLHFDISSINVLPLLMGVVFFVQQKYMAPPPSPTMSKDQIQQQKIMRVMMVVFMPLVLYSAPSGLILYILTSSTLGVIESRYIRSHIDQLDIEVQRTPKPRKKKKPRDPQARAMADAIERAKQKRKGPPKSYKKRPKG